MDPFLRRRPTPPRAIWIPRFKVYPSRVGDGDFVDKVVMSVMKDVIRDWMDVSPGSFLTISTRALMASGIHMMIFDAFDTMGVDIICMDVATGDIVKSRPDIEWGGVLEFAGILPNMPDEHDPWPVATFLSIGKIEPYDIPQPVYFGVDVVPNIDDVAMFLSKPVEEARDDHSAGGA